MMIIINAIQTMMNTAPSIARAVIKVLLLTLLLLVVDVGRQDGPILVVEISPVPINKAYNYRCNYYIIT